MLLLLLLLEFLSFLRLLRAKLLLLLLVCLVLFRRFLCWEQVGEEWAGSSLGWTAVLGRGVLISGRSRPEGWAWVAQRLDSEEDCMALQTVWRVLRRCLEMPRVWELPQ